MSHDIHSARIQQAQLHAQQIASQQQGNAAMMAQDDSEAGFQEWIDEGSFNPTLIARRFEQLELRSRRTKGKEDTEKTEKKEEEELLQVKALEEIAEQTERQNPELHTRSLLVLKARIKQEDKMEDVLRKVLEMYPDFSLADEALDFLLRTSKGELNEQVRLAKENLNERYGRDIRAGRNMAAQAREFSTKGLGSPTQLRTVYREVVSNPRDSNTLFNELSTKFEYEKMKTLIDFLLHSLGSDLRSKGSSIDHAELHRLMTETRKLQSILGIFRFFKSRMALIAQAFARQGMQLPGRITFEALAKLFMKYLQERYPSTEKLLQMVISLGFAEEWIAQIILLTQLRDGVRGVAPKLFKSEQHRHEVLKSYIDAIEELDEKLEEDEEEDEEDKEDKEDPKKKKDK